MILAQQINPDTNTTPVFRSLAKEGAVEKRRSVRCARPCASTGEPVGAGGMTFMQARVALPIAIAPAGLPTLLASPRLELRRPVHLYNSQSEELLPGPPRHGPPSLGLLLRLSWRRAAKPPGSVGDDDQNDDPSDDVPEAFVLQVQGGLIVYSPLGR
jgi:hypothetical protein